MLRTLFFGLLFGFILVKSGVTDYDTIANMFLLKDAHVMIVMGVAIGIAGIGMYIFRRTGVKSIDGGKLPLEKKPRTPGNLWGGLIFGAGWAITGTCPGTALAQLGQGSLTALFTIGGIVLGTLLYRKVGADVERRLARKARPSVALGGPATVTVKVDAMQ